MQLLDILEFVKVVVSPQDFYFYAWMCGMVLFFAMRVPMAILDIETGGTGEVFPRGGIVLELATIYLWPITITYLALRWIYRRFK